MNHMDVLFYTPKNYVNTRDTMKCWVKEASNFRVRPNQIYKNKLLMKAYQLLVIFARYLYGQESKKTFS